MLMPTVTAVAENSVFLGNGDDLNTNFCWRCIDTPCMTMPKLKFPPEAYLSSTVGGLFRCPTDALSQGTDGVISIDEGLCIGCGICVVSCPVNAMKINPNAAVPVVQMTNIGTKLPIEQLLAERDVLNGRLDFIEAPANTFVTQIKKIRQRLDELGQKSPGSQNVISRNFIRSTFIRMGARVALRQQGANSLLSELVLEENGRIFLGEISTTDDTLDPIRRLLSSAAHALAKLSATRESLTLILVVKSLPNKRVDLYRLLNDIRKYLKLEILILPFDALVLANLKRKINVYETFSGFSISEGNESLVPALVSTFGQDFKKLKGFEPGK